MFPTRRRTRLWLRALESRVAPAVFPVTTTADTGPGSLREAITAANVSADFDQILFDATAFATPQVVRIYSTLPTITAQVEIVGTSAANVTIERDEFSGQMRVLTTNVADGGPVTLRNLTLKNGYFPGGSGVVAISNDLVATDCVFKENEGTFNSFGGAIQAYQSDVTLERCTFIDNNARTGGALYVYESSSLSMTDCKLAGNVAWDDSGFVGAGAVYVSKSNASFVRCTFADNRANRTGGGAVYISQNPAPVSFLNCSFTNNGSEGAGGAIYTRVAKGLVIDGCTFEANYATKGQGGAISFYASDGGTIVRSTLSGNRARDAAGIELYNTAALSVRNTTIVSNVANGQGGGIRIPAGATTSLDIASSIIAFNSAYDSVSGPDVFSQQQVTVNQSAIGNVGGFTMSGSGNVTAGLGSLEPLADNGGPTKTHRLRPGSIYVNAGSNPTGATTDQRGLPRVVGGIADMGAFESQYSFLVTNTGDSGAGSLRQAVLDANAAPGPDTITFDATFYGVAKTIALTTGELAISDQVTIEGPSIGALSVSGNLAGRVFNTSSAAAGTPITLRNIRLANGKASTGGALLVDDERLIILDSQIRSSSATAGYGGGIHVAGTGAVLDLRNVLFFGNTSTVNGGGLGITNASTVTLTGVSFQNNTAANSGGGMRFGGGSLVVSESNFQFNRVTNGAGFGAAITVAGSVGTTAIVRNSTFYGNSVAGVGGAILVGGTVDSVLIQNSTVYLNTATSSGGGINVQAGSVQLTVESSIVAANVAPSGPDIFSANAVAVGTSAIGSAAGYVQTDKGGNLAYGIDLKLGPSLSSNGGSTFALSLAPQPGSPLIDAGSNSAGSTADQRGGDYARVNGKAADIGAVERQWVVTSREDRGPNTLRQAIVEANAVNGADTITFDFAVTPTITLNSGALTVTSDVAIQGASYPRPVISGNYLDRVFVVGGSSSTSVSLSYLRVSDAWTRGSGGAIYSVGGALSIDHSTISLSTGSYVGGIAHFASTALTIRDSTIQSNSASVNVGAVTSYGPATIERTTISSNSAASGYGALYTTASLTITDSQISNNTAQVQAVGRVAGGLLLERSAIVNNTSSLDTGGLFLTTTSTTTPYVIRNSTLARNTAGGAGGGALLVGWDSGQPFNAPLVIQNSTITQNTLTSGVGAGVYFRFGTGSVSVDSSIISGNSAGSQPDIAAGGKSVAVNFSAIGSTSGFTLNGTNNLPIGTNLKLTALGSYGGLTQTYAFASDSPLRNAGSNPAGLTYDQRGVGFTRIDEAASDIGAYEDQHTFTVTNANQSGPGSLQQAMYDVNYVPGTDTIVFDPAVFSTPQSITLTTTQLPTIYSSLAIVGPGSKLLTVQYGTTYYGRMFEIQLGATDSVTISGMSIRNARSFDDGGGIKISNGVIVLTDLDVSDCSSTYGGSGIYVSYGTVTISDSRIANNTSGSSGGGVVNHGNISIARTVISGNSAKGFGGGGVGAFGPTTITDSTIEDNTASTWGGGIVVFPNSNLVLRRTTVAGNTAGIVGGGLAMLSSSSIPLTVLLENTTLSGNAAPAAAGIALGTSTTSLFNGVLNINNSTIAGNTSTTGPSGIVFMSGSPTVTINSSVVSGNGGGDISVPGTITLNASAVGSSAGFSFSGTGNLPFGADLKLSPLGAHGGPTPSHKPLFGSPLIDAGSNPGSLTTDQRGYARIVGANVDIGAVEIAITSITGVTRQGAEYTNAASVSWSVVLASPVVGLSTANFTLVGAGAAGAVVTGIIGSGTSYTVTASVGADGPLGLQPANSTGLDLEVSNVPYAGEVFQVDRSAPTVAILASTGMIFDYNTGSESFSLTAQFSEPMNIGVAPVITFPVETPGAALHFTGGQWISATEYRAKFNAYDLNQSLPAIDVRVAGGKDLAGNVHGQTTAADVFSIDTQNPIIPSIVRDQATANNLTNVSWTVTFSEPVIGAAAGNFQLFNGSLGGTPAITSVTGSGTTWVVEATTGAGTGTLALYVISPVGITDSAGNLLAALPVTGPAYTIDHVAPSVAKLAADNLLLNDAVVGPAGLTLTVTYNEPMNQAVLPAVAFPVENPGATLSLAMAQWIDARTFSATFSVADLGIELADIDVSVSGAQDAVGNPQSAIVIGDLLDIDTHNPTVASIVRVGPNPTAAATVDYLVTLSQPAPGLAASHFAIQATGLTGAGIVGVIGGPTQYTVRVNRGTGTGTVRLDLVNSAGVGDAAGNAITGLPFAGETFSIVAPVPPRVAAVHVNEGASQRSRVTSLTVDFDMPVTLAGNPADAFVLARQGGGTVTIAGVTWTGNSARLTFSGTSTVANSLVDGRYTLKVLASQVTAGGTPLDGNGDGTPGDDYVLTGTPTNGLFRLFGDADGDGTVTATDFLAFRLAFLSASPVFDFDNNGQVDAGDLLQFRLRFLQSV
ncbi:MAG: right-handed parallel beta-helix repeat-containing protein [Gemmataceae bacterium]|nr:right-handed parallel beta-helix repeat-containing protein [Gemmataceae bacterium]